MHKNILFKAFIVLGFISNLFSQTSIGVAAGVNWLKPDKTQDKSISDGGSGENYSVLLCYQFSRFISTGFTVGYNKYVNRTRVFSYDLSKHYFIKSISEMSEFSFQIRPQIPIQEFKVIFIIAPTYHKLNAATIEYEDLNKTEDVTNKSDRGKSSLFLGGGLGYTSFECLTVSLETRYMVWGNSDNTKYYHISVGVLYSI